MAQRISKTAFFSQRQKARYPLLLLPNSSGRWFHSPPNKALACPQTIRAADAFVLEERYEVMASWTYEMHEICLRLFLHQHNRRIQNILNN